MRRGFRTERGGIKCTYLTISNTVHLLSFPSSASTSCSSCHDSVTFTYIIILHIHTNKRRTNRKKQCAVFALLLHPFSITFLLILLPIRRFSWFLVFGFFPIPICPNCIHITSAIHIACSRPSLCFRYTPSFSQQYTHTRRFDLFIDISYSSARKIRSLLSAFTSLHRFSVQLFSTPKRTNGQANDAPLNPGELFLYYHLFTTCIV